MERSDIFKFIMSNLIKSLSKEELDKQEQSFNEMYEILKEKSGHVGNFDNINQFTNTLNSLFNDTRSNISDMGFKMTSINVSISDDIGQYNYGLCVVSEVWTNDVVIVMRSYPLAFISLKYSEDSTILSILDCLVRDNILTESYGLDIFHALRDISNKIKACNIIEQYGVDNENYELCQVFYNKRSELL